MMVKKIEDKLFRLIDNEDEKEVIVSAIETGRESYKRGFDEQVRDGYIKKGTRFIAPPKEDLLQQGLDILENDDDYEEVDK